MDSITLTHHGIIGMKWGRRRYQNKDGSLTPEGRKRYGDGPGDGGRSGKPRGASNRPKSSREMTDDELRAAINNLQLQKQYNTLYREMNPEKVSKGKKFVGDFIDKAVIPAVTEGGKQLLKDAMTKAGKKALGLDDKDADNGLEALKKTAEVMGYKSKIAAAESVIRKNEDAKRAAKSDKKDSSDSDSSKPKSESKPKADEPEIIIPTKVVEKDYNSPSSTYSVAAQRFMMEERIANRKIIEADDRNPQLSVAARRLIAGVSDVKLDDEFKHSILDGEAFTAMYGEGSLQHWKYIKRERKNGKWIYTYPDEKGARKGKQSDAVKKTTKTADELMAELREKHRVARKSAGTESWGAYEVKRDLSDDKLIMSHAEENLRSMIEVLNEVNVDDLPRDKRKEAKAIIEDADKILSEWKRLYPDSPVSKEIADRQKAVSENASTVDKIKDKLGVDEWDNYKLASRNLKLAENRLEYAQYAVDTLKSEENQEYWTTKGKGIVDSYLDMHADAKAEVQEATTNKNEAKKESDKTVVGMVHNVVDVGKDFLENLFKKKKK